MNYIHMLTKMIHIGEDIIEKCLQDGGYPWAEFSEHLNDPGVQNWIVHWANKKFEGDPRTTFALAYRAMYKL